MDVELISSSDSSTGIRPINKIKKLPVDQLTDEEVCKLFYQRFDAVAMAIIYMDKDGNKFKMLRGRNTKSATAFIKEICQVMYMKLRM